MFQIGEFSKISKVSKRLLHHYDELDLLKPVHIDAESGYRFYSAKQLPRLNQILALKDLGISLKQIARMINDQVSNEDIQGMLKIRQAEVRQDLDESMAKIAKIESRLKFNLAAQSPPDIVVKTVPDLRYFSCRKEFSNEEEMMHFIYRLHSELEAGLPKGSLGLFMAIAHSKEFTVENTDIEMGFIARKNIDHPIELGRDTLAMRQVKGADLMATAAFVGVSDPELMGLGCIAQWIEDNGYRMNGPYREIILSGHDMSNMGEVVVEIQIPIVRSDE